jgi:hypothetical protein
MARTLSYLAERSSHERQDGPAAQHAKDVNRDGQQRHRLRKVPGQEIDRDDTRVLGREDADCQQKSQEDKGLYVSHRGSPLPKRLVVDDAIQEMTQADITMDIA